MTVVWPLATPPEKRTVKGAVMSIKMARLWTWLQACGVHLTDWSTGQGVDREFPKLAALDRWLAAAIERPQYPAGAPTRADMQFLQLMLRGIMARRRCQCCDLPLDACKRGPR